MGLGGIGGGSDFGLSSGVGLIGQAAGIGTGFGLAEHQASEAIDRAKIGRRFTKNLATAKYQIMMKDLRAAGLNPILAAKGGFSPGGTPSAAIAQVPNYGQAVASGLTSATDAGRAPSQVALAKQQKQVANAVEAKELANEKKVVSETDLNRTLGKESITRAAYYKAQEAAGVANARQTNAMARQTELGIPLAEADAEFYNTPAGKFLRWVERGSSALQGVRPRGGRRPGRGPGPQSERTPGNFGGPNPPRGGKKKR